LALRFNVEILEVHAAKNDAGFGWGGDKSQVAIDTSMESTTFGNGRSDDSSLEHVYSQW